MRPLLSLLAALAALSLAAACGDEQREDGPPAARESGSAAHFALRQVASGLVRPTFVGAVPGDRRGLYVLEQPGRLVRIEAGRRPQILVDMRDEVRTGAEQGLLGLAFHPDFARNRRLYLHWTNRQGDTRVGELTLGGERRRKLLSVDQPE